MEVPPDLISKLDFAHGKEFQQKVLVRYGMSVHHPSSSSDGSFLPLAVFHRFTVRLTEEFSGSIGVRIHAGYAVSPAANLDPQP